MRNYFYDIRLLDTPASVRDPACIRDPASIRTNKCKNCSLYTLLTNFLVIG